MALRKPNSEKIKMNADIEVIGKGNIGDKARQLIEKTPRLREIGFHTPKRTVLAEDYFDGFFQRNNLGANLRDAGAVEDLERKIRSGSLTREEFEILQGVTSSFNGSPLAVRSSAEGDSRGTGTYNSTFCDSAIGNVRRSVQEVLASYFSEDAVAFRKDADTGEGFGVMIEPIIGQDFGRCFAPVMSGFGYTSTSRGEGYINIVPGLGGGVDTKDGERITKSAIEKFDGNLKMYILQKKRAMFSGSGRKVKRRSALLQTDQEWSFGDSYSGKAFIVGRHHDRVSKTSIHLKDCGISRPLGKFDLNPFFGMMGEMENRFGGPQYFEWATTLDDDGPKYWITQIADVSKKLDVMDFEDLGDVMFMGHTVTGTGVKECDKIAFCWNPNEVDSLYEFNKDHGDYALIFSSRLTTSNMSRGVRQLRYSDFSNASVFLELQDAAHSGDPVSHLGGQLDVTGKLFGVMDRSAEVLPQWDKFDSKAEKYGEIRVYQGKTRTIGSEKQNRIVVSALD